LPDIDVAGQFSLLYIIRCDNALFLLAATARLSGVLHPSSRKIVHGQAIGQVLEWLDDAPFGWDMYVDLPANCVVLLSHHARRGGI
jgi:hypothetical protein